jgi:hypothetical protein
MNLKNAKTLSAALILSLAALSTAHAADSRIVDLPAITVQPDAALRAELASHANLVAHIVDLPAVTVRPTIEQLAERAAIVAATQAQALTAQLAASLMAETLAVAQP